MDDTLRVDPIVRCPCGGALGTDHVARVPQTTSGTLATYDENGKLLGIQETNDPNPDAGRPVLSKPVMFRAHSPAIAPVLRLIRYRHECQQGGEPGKCRRCGRG